MTSTNHDLFDERIAHWLQTGPIAGPRSALSAALDTVADVPQRRARLPRSISLPVVPRSRLVWFAITVLLLLALIGSLVAGAALLRLARPKPLPGNGAIVVEVFGSLEALDPVTGGVIGVLGSGAYTDASWSPDGLQLAIAREDGVWVRDISSDAIEVQFVRESKVFDCTPTDVCTVSWSPDGTRLAVAHGSDIEVIDPGGNGRRTVVNVDGSVYRPTWAPDGQTLAFEFITPTTGPQAKGDEYIYSVAANGHGLTVLTGPMEPDSIRFPDLRWSPDGARLAWIDQEPERAVKALDIGSSTPHTLVHLGICCPGPAPGLAWSPDGRFIAVGITSGDAPGGLLVINSDGTGLPRQLVDDGVWGSIAWQPRP